MSRSDPRGPLGWPGYRHIIFVHTERHLFISRDSGATWTRLAANLPTTRYDDILIHPRTHDLVLATHGRSLWILDDASVLADMSPQVAQQKAHIFAVPRATLMLNWEDISNVAHGFYAGENPPDGATFTYYLGAPAQSVKLTVRNAAGKVVREITGTNYTGEIQRASWDLRWPPAPPGLGGRGGGGGEEGGGGAEEGGARGAGGARAAVVQLPIPAHDIGNRGVQVSPGAYTVTLNVDGDSTTRSFAVRGDPQSNLTALQYKARETFLLDVQDTQAKMAATVAALRTKRQQATPDEATKIQALERRLTQAAGRTGRIPGSFNGQGAQQGSFQPPTGQQKNLLAEAKAELASVRKEGGVR